VRVRWSISIVAMIDIEPLLVELRQFVAERDWAQFHDPKNLAMLVGSEAGELLAEYRWVGNADADAHSRVPAARARIAAEIGDVGIALLLLCDRIGLDPIVAMREKLAANRRKYPVERARGRADLPTDAG
jgi:dCTP diphosphatase